MSQSPTLVYLSYSPWSLQARWALAHHEVSYEGQPYQPTLGEPRLRLRLRQWRGKVTVPVWFDGDRVLTDSYDIAKEAERRGSGPPLFPEGHEAEIRQWSERSQAMLRVGRARFALAARDDTDTVLELLPPVIRKLGPLGPFIARSAMRSFIRKYDLDDPQAADETVLHEGFEALRAAIGSGPYVLDAFSYADIVMTMAVSMLAPIQPPLFGSASTKLPPMADPKLVERYADLVRWRDALLDRHHPTAGSAS